MFPLRKPLNTPFGPLVSGLVEPQQPYWFLRLTRTRFSTCRSFTSCALLNQILNFFGG
jgi:hypothetical protein